MFQLKKMYRNIVYLIGKVNEVNRKDNTEFDFMRKQWFDGIKDE